MLFATRQRSSPHLRLELEPFHWLGTTPSLDLADDKLRFKALSLTQLTNTDRERAVSVFQFVRSLPFGYGKLMRHPTARQVLDAQMGDNYGKSALFVALLRSLKIPARVRMVQLRGDLVAGYAGAMDRVNHAITEVWLDNAWHKTDAYTYDLAYLALARQRLDELGLVRGLCIFRGGNSDWQGDGDAFCALAADLGVFNEPQEFLNAGHAKARAGGALRSVQFGVVSRLLNRGIAQLRQSQPSSGVQPQASAASQKHRAA
jgi:hypothetical protein